VAVLGRRLAGGDVVLVAQDGGRRAVLADAVAPVDGRHRRHRRRPRRPRRRRSRRRRRPVEGVVLGDAVVVGAAVQQRLASAARFLDAVLRRPMRNSVKNPVAIAKRQRFTSAPIESREIIVGFCFQERTLFRLPTRSVQ